MVPARQRLEAGDRAIVEPHDRLIEDRDLLALERPPQIGFDRQPVGFARPHRRLEHLDAVAAVALGVIHGEFGVLEPLLGALRLGVAERHADRAGEEDLAIVEGDRRAQRAADGFGKRGDARGVALRQNDEAELIAGQPGERVLRLDQAPEPARQRQQDRVGERHADRVVDLLEAIDVDHHHGRADGAVGRGQAEHGFEPVEEQLAVGQAGEIVVHGVVQQPLFGGLEFGDVGQRADQADDFAVGADHRPRAQREPQIMAVGGAHAEVLRDTAAALFDDAVERGAEAVAIERMQNFEPVRGGAVERSALEPEHRFGFRAGEHAVGGDVPVPDHVAGAGQRQRAALDVGYDALRHAAGEGVLHHGKADQHDDQHEAAEQRRADNVVGDQADHRQRGAEHPGDQQTARSGSASPRGQIRGSRDRRRGRSQARR